MKFRYKNRIPFRSHGQAIVEFAIVAPVLMLLLIGLFEVGRMMYVYTAVTNASREAVRYASAVGYDDYGKTKYKHCAGIREMARRSAYFMNLQPADIEIRYDKGPNDPIYSDGHGPDTDTEWNSLRSCQGDVDPGYFISSGDRVLVKVTGQYTPYTKLVPWGTRPFVSSSARTVLGFIALTTTPGGGGGGAIETPSSTDTPSPTETPGPSPTPTETVTLTATFEGPWFTLTPWDTPTATPETTIMPTNTVTATSTNTPTSTDTPTFTPTVMAGCDSITAGNFRVSDNGISITIRNPHDSIMVESIQLTWNHDAGGAAPDPTLTLQYITLENQAWSVNEIGPSASITPSPAMIIPGNNAESTTTFLFNKSYQTIDGTEAITISFSTVGCEPIQIKVPLLTPTP